MIEFESLYKARTALESLGYKDSAPLLGSNLFVHPTKPRVVLVQINGKWSPFVQMGEHLFDG